MMPLRDLLVIAQPSAVAVMVSATLEMPSSGTSTPRGISACRPMVIPMSRGAEVDDVAGAVPGIELRVMTHASGMFPRPEPGRRRRFTFGITDSARRRRACEFF